MTFFEMIKYHGREYPTDIPLRIEEIAGHFDITSIYSELDISLHTEYSYGKRNFNSRMLAYSYAILSANKDGVPQLWKNEKWAEQFADFISMLIGDGKAPRVIEIHPPFNDYTDIDGFIKTYSKFEYLICERYPEAEILVENRCGSVYSGGRFIVSKIQEVDALCDAISNNNLKLRIAYDIPQIYTAHNAKTEEQYLTLLDKTKQFTGYIGGVHLWGKKLSETGRKVAHCGNLDTYFGDSEIKKRFLLAFKDCFDDDIVRKMVLEVNSGNKDLLAIIEDLKSVGISFV